MDLTDMNRIIDISTENSTVTAEAGITFGELSPRSIPWGTPSVLAVTPFIPPR